MWLVGNCFCALRRVGPRGKVGSRHLLTKLPWLGLRVNLPIISRFGESPAPRNTRFGGWASGKYEPPVHSLPLLGLPVFLKHRFVVLVEEWFIETGFNDRLDGEEDHNRTSQDRYIYIHGTNREDLIGQPASAGCVCLRNADVIQLYDLIPIGTRFEITA